MAKYHYNLPWSGRLGCISNKCVCGRQLSPHSSRSLCHQPDCVSDPIVVAEIRAEYEKRATEWCLERRINFKATVANYLEHLGPHLQERDGPIPGAKEAEESESLIVYLSSLDFACL